MAKARNTNRRRPSKQKEIDETLIDVVDVRDKTQEFFEDNKTLIIGALAALIIIVGGYIIYKYMYKAPRETQAMEQIFKAESQFARDSFALALENPGAGYDGFLDIIDNYSGTKTANLAKYYAGVSYLNLGRFEDAISYLESYSPSGNVTPIMKNGAIGDAHAELGNLDKAISFYQKAANANGNAFLTPYYLNKLGLLSRKQGDKDAAKAAFTKIKNDFPGSVEAGTADKYISSL